jgi:alpha-L-arabinofuranosidase
MRWPGGNFLNGVQLGRTVLGKRTRLDRIQPGLGWSRTITHVGTDEWMEVE